MEWLSRWRADLGRPELPTGREELPFLVLSSLTVTVVARLTDDTPRSWISSCWYRPCWPLPRGA